MRADPAALPAALGGRRLQGGVPGGGFGPRDQRPRRRGGHALRLDYGAGPGGSPLAAGRAAAAAGGRRRAGGDPRQWVAILCLEEPDGALMNLAEGVARAAPDASEVTLDLGDVCVELPPASRLALLVSGGLARRFPAPATAAEQRVHGASLTLTVI